MMTWEIFSVLRYVGCLLTLYCKSNFDYLTILNVSSLPEIVHELSIAWKCFFTQHFLYQIIYIWGSSSTSSHSRTKTSGRDRLTDCDTHTHTHTHTLSSEKQNKRTDRMLNSICDCSAQDRHTVMDCCRFRVHRGTDQRHAKSRGKPWQHTATKSSTTTMKGSSEARKERHRATPSLFSFIFFTLDGNTEPSKASFFFLLHCNKHTNTERNTKWPCTVKCVCLRTHTRSDTQNTHTAGCESAVHGGGLQK